VNGYGEEKEDKGGVDNGCDIRNDGCNGGELCVMTATTGVGRCAGSGGGTVR